MISSPTGCDSALRAAVPNIAGDDSIHQPLDLLPGDLEGAMREARELDGVALGDLVVDTDEQGLHAWPSRSSTGPTG